MIALTKINVAGVKEDYSLCTQYKAENNQFRIMLISLENDKYFKGILREEFMKEKALKMKIPYENYLDETKSALKCASSNLKFVYDIKKNGDVYVFEWKKLIEEEEMKILFGSVDLSVSNVKDVMESMLELFAVNINNLKNETTLLKQKQVQLIKDKNEAKALLEETATWKENLEKELYSKFIIILNSKKEKIKELEHQLEEVASNNDSNTGRRVKSTNRGKEAEDDQDVVPNEEVDTKLIPKRKGRYIRKNTSSTKVKEVATEPSGSSRKYRRVDASKSYFEEKEEDSDDLFDNL